MAIDEKNKPRDTGYKVAGPVQPSTPPTKVPPPPAQARLVSLDAYRGAIMLLMASAGFGMHEVYKNLLKSGVPAESTYARVMQTIAGQLEHVPWQGGVLWDLIQPAFMFMVGVALPFSYSRRAARGQSYFGRLMHTLFRSVLLILLGVFLSTKSGAKETNFIFTNVLAQIGLGYPFLFLFVNRKWWLQVAAIAAILGADWWLFYQHPLPPPEFDYATVGVQADDPHRADKVPEGLKQHWAIHTNFAEQEDQKILNWFPRAKPFDYNPGGYATLNFLPSLGTMLLGLMIGELVRSPRKDREKLRVMLIAGAVCLVLGVAAHYTLCPVVKRIWTPSWALASGGVVIWFLACFYLVCDVWGWRRLAWPLAVVGMNSIAVYLMSQLMTGATEKALRTHFSEPYRRFAEWATAKLGGAWDPELFGGIYGPLWESLGVLLVFWLICVWLWRQKVIIRL